MNLHSISRKLYQSPLYKNTSLFLAVAGLLLSGCGGPEVETIRPRRGAIQESFSEQARTRLKETYRVSMPVRGKISRIDLEPGDPVTKGQALTEYDLVPLRELANEARAAVAEYQARIAVNEDNQLEMTALTETKTAVEAAEQALNALDAEIEAEKKRAERAVKELERRQALRETGAIPGSEFDDAQLAADTALIELRRQEFYRAAYEAILVITKLGPRAVEQFMDRERLERVALVYQKEQAQARLARAEHDLKLARLLSPIDGAVLERHEQGDAMLEAGTPLLLLGDLSRLEVIADVLTQDALRLAPGAPVELEPGVDHPLLHGKVKRIEPAGFTKLSSLGVEQQRVNVIIALEGDHESLGTGYQLQARFLTREKQDAIIIPRYSALQSQDGDFYVFKVVNSALKKQIIELGLTNDLELEVSDGLSPEDTIVAAPTSKMKDGAPVVSAPAE